jgi:hypothetical protein
MFARLLAASAFALTFCLTGGAVGEPSPARPRAQSAPSESMTAVEAAVGEIGAWSLEYIEILTQAGAVMDEIDAYTVILDRFASRDLRQREALRQIEAWRANVISRAQALRANAIALRAPPSLTVFGERGAQLENALATARADLPVLVDEMTALLEACADLGAEAVRSPTKAADARRRAVYASSVQLIRIDTRRISANLAALPEQHPSHALLRVTLAYYSGLQSLPAHELRLLDGVESAPTAVAAGLRRSAQEMRAELAQVMPRAESLEREMRATPHPPEGRSLVQALTQMLQTYPETVRVYGLLADTLDNAASNIEGGVEVSEAWARQEEAALPLLDQITRLDNQRAQLAAAFRR